MADSDRLLFVLTGDQPFQPCLFEHVDKDEALLLRRDFRWNPDGDLKNACFLRGQQPAA
jgi:hypothetical protein